VAYPNNVKLFGIILGAALSLFGFFEAVIANRRATLCRYWLCWDQAVVENAYRGYLGGSSSPQQFSSDLVQALLRDPASSYRWCDLGEALLAEGHREKAAYCMRRAVALGPDSAAVLLRRANFDFRVGADREALAGLAHILTLLPDYDEIVFSNFDRFGGGIEQVLSFGLPAQKRAGQAFFHHLLQIEAPPSDVQTTWKWLASRSLIDPHLSVEYVNFLLSSRQYDDAVAAWLEAVGPNRGDYMRPNRVFNGDFQLAESGAAFDWHLDSVDGAQVTRETSGPHSGAASMHIHFAGTHNIDFHHLSEAIAVTPRSYRLEYFVKALGLTTNEGVRVRIFDPEDPSRLDVITDPVLGSLDWQRQEKNVVITPRTRIVRLSVVRLPSRKFDNKIAGDAWISGVKLLPN